tara:strand:- start:1397 stop:1597 length:201 start_codon:yes stop_codon:yes gene_type:complete
MAHKSGIEIDIGMYLASLHTGQWFGFDDTGKQEYENVVIHDDTKSLPTKAECEAGIIQMKIDWNVE